MSTVPALSTLLRTWPRLPAAEVTARLGISRATLLRAVRELGEDIVSRGRARRTRYAIRRSVRGSKASIPVHRIDEAGQAHRVALIDPIWPDGCAVEFFESCPWPLDRDMQDGWFEGLPWMFDDLRPQGFLGRHLASHYAASMRVDEDPGRWSEDDVLSVLTVVGDDQPGDIILGDTALERWLARRVRVPDGLVDDAAREQRWPALAAVAMARGLPESSAGGEFPKFTALREVAGEVKSVLVKFSGSDDSPGSRRWADLLVCEHLAGVALAGLPGLEAARSQLTKAGGRTFLEVERFDRQGAFGRSPVCSWAALNAGLLGLSTRAWSVGATALRTRGWLSDEAERAIATLWEFGQMIANTDMHEGNLSFRPGLRLAPVYDMLPMAYAPQGGMELPRWTFAPALPLPAQRPAWETARPAAEAFWAMAAGDSRISEDFRDICAENAQYLRDIAWS